MKLLILQDNWADEIDFACVAVLTDEEHEKYLQYLDGIKDWSDCGIGTNEGVDYHGKQDFLKKLRVLTVPADAEAFLKNAFRYPVGCWPYPLNPEEAEFQ